MGKVQCHVGSCKIRTIVLIQIAAIISKSKDSHLLSNAILQYSVIGRHLKRINSLKVFNSKSRMISCRSKIINNPHRKMIGSIFKSSKNSTNDDLIDFQRSPDLMIDDHHVNNPYISDYTIKEKALEAFLTSSKYTDCLTSERDLKRWLGLLMSKSHERANLIVRTFYKLKEKEPLEMTGSLMRTRVLLIWSL
jgi:hypothetical protein